MRFHRLIALALVFSILTPAAFANQLSDQRDRVQSAKSRVVELEQHLASLLAELNSAERDLSSAYGRLSVSQLQLFQAEDAVARARQTLSNRARYAYMKGASRSVDLLLGAQTFLQFLSSSRILAAGLSADVDAQRELIAARDDLVQSRQVADHEKQGLTEATRRLNDLRTEIQSALQSEQRVLTSAQAELDQMLASRRRASSASPGVEARRAARQVVLDRKLAELLAWYAPGKGVEPFMPAKLKGTGITTSGLSSWYGPGFDGRRASSGATYRMNQLTAASLVLPFGTLLKVTYGGKSVVVVITDRGPYVAGRVLDLSWGAAEALGLSGVKEVRMEIVLPTEPAPPFP